MAPIDPVAELLAIEHIKRLKATYWRTVDAKDYPAWRAVFTDDVALDLPGMTPESVDEFVALAAEFLDGALTVHHGHNPEIVVTGTDTAEGTWAFQDHIEWPPQDGERRGYVGRGRYVESYRRVAGEWRISAMQIRFYRVDSLSGPPVEPFPALRDELIAVPGAYAPAGGTR